MNCSETWFIVDSGPGDAAFNMALDESLLFFGSLLNRPVLRFYGWSQPAATFGYFQKFSAVETLTDLRPLIRRTTGGGLVPHAGDWTYSVVFPPDHEWYQRRAGESYRQLHLWMRAGWHELGVVTELAPESIHADPAQCFVGAEASDLLWLDRKMAGAAQRRSRHGLLIQGSVQRHPHEISRQEWQQAWCDLTRRRRGVDWAVLEPSGAMMDLAWRLTAEKYSREDYNRRR
jgi:lipoyl(octanoyl) transferase